MAALNENDTGLITRWRRLTPADRRALVPAAWRLIFVRVSLGTIGLNRTQRMLGRWAPAGTAILESPARWHERAIALRRTGKRTPGARCLARSVVLWWWMRGAGLDPQLRMGVRSGERTVEGHAWIECDGHIIDESTEQAATFSDLNWRSPR